MTERKLILVDKPTKGENCRWASEIEQYSIAVCKARFGDEEAAIDGDVRSYL